MKRSISKTLALILAVCLAIPLAACGGKRKGADTLVIGYDYFSSKFSPFFAKTEYDMNVAEMVSIPLLGTDREGNMVLNGIKGETVRYNGNDYQYTGVADCKIIQNDDGTVTYDFQLRDDIKFSDGEKLTADDVIFSMYVLSDPSYDGSGTFYSAPIIGMTEYRIGVTSDIYEKYSAIADKIFAAGPNNMRFTEFSEDLAKSYWGECLEKAGEKFVAEICNYCLTTAPSELPNYGNNEIALGMGMWGYGKRNDDGSLTDTMGKTYDLKESFPTAKDYWSCLTNAYGDDFSAETGIDQESAGTSIAVFLKEAFVSINGPKDTNANETISSISGIEKTGEYSVRITLTQFDATAIYTIGNITIAPLHYYGSVDAYNYDKHEYGFTKGDLSGVKEKTTVPMGAGPYQFISYKDGIVTFRANDSYYKSKPKIENILFKETPASDKLAGVISGAFDITEPNFSVATVDSIKDYNSNHELIGDAITTQTVDNLGYGYIGISADNVKVGTDKASAASKNLRKAFATLFAVYRDSSINSYYGDRAAVVQYPISNTSWAAPKPADDGYQIAYSTDADGNPIYNSAMSEEEKYQSALDAVVGYLKNAGYTWNDTAGKFTAAPAGAKMSYEIIIPADGSGNHPSYAILTSAKEALAAIGITLEINDPSDSNQIWVALESGTAEMWTAAWQATPDPDLYQIYHSANIVGQGGTDSNHYAIEDHQLDELIVAARASTDRSYRRTTYKQCLDIILDWGVEVPCYQRQNAVIFSTQRVNISTLTPDITPFWGWMAEIETLEMN